MAKKLSDQDRTSEFQIPEEILKKESEAIREKHAAVSKQLEEAKAEMPVRKQDEATKVFQLRQLQVARRVDELESKKSEFEQMMELLEKQKNKINGDFQKVSKYLQQESKKKEVLDKNLLHRIAVLAEAKVKMGTDIEWLKSNQQKFESTVLEIKQSCSEVVAKLHQELKESRSVDQKWEQNLTQLEDQVRELRAQLAAKPEPKVMVDNSSDLQAKKEIFKKHLQNFLSPDQQDMVGEMLEDLFKALKIQK